MDSIRMEHLIPLGRTLGPGVDGDELGEVVAARRATDERINALEAHDSATARVIAAAAQATLFVQGSYRFEQPGSGRPLRLIIGPSGRPVQNAMGFPALSLEGDGPPLEIFVTGTGFVVGADGRAITNRHVAFPWEFDEAAIGILQSGMTARWTRFVGFVGDDPKGHDLDPVLASEDADLALVQLHNAPENLPFLRLATESLSPGEPIVVMGYPLGLLRRGDHERRERRASTLTRRTGGRGQYGDLARVRRI